MSKEQHHATLTGTVSKIVEEPTRRVAYITFNGDKLSSRLFEALSGGPTLALLVPEGTCKVGDVATVTIDIKRGPAPAKECTCSDGLSHLLRTHAPGCPAAVKVQ